MAAGNTKPSLTKYNEQEALNLGLGQAGVAFLSGTTKYIPPSGLVVVAIQFVEDTLFDAATDGNETLAVDQSASTDASNWPTDEQGGPGTGSVAINQTMMLAGMTIYGRWKQVTFDSGKAFLYLG